MNAIKALTLSLPLVLPLAACAGTPTIYESKPLQAWVVDADTGQPIEGVVVLARWEMLLLGQKDVGDTYTPRVVETATDSTGKFLIPGWGPEPVCCGFMDWRDPELFIFKPGYSGIIKSDSPSLIVDDPRVRKSSWNGEKLPLKAYKGNYTGDEGKKDFRDFENFSNDVMFGFLWQSQNPCGWTKVPKMMEALYKQSQLVGKHGYKDYESMVVELLSHDDEITKDDHCISPRKFFQGFEQ